MKDQRENVASQNALDILNWCERGAAALPAASQTVSVHLVPVSLLQESKLPAPPPEGQAHCLRNSQWGRQAAWRQRHLLWTWEVGLDFDTGKQGTGGGTQRKPRSEETVSHDGGGGLVVPGEKEAWCLE